MKPATQLTKTLNYAALTVDDMIAITGRLGTILAEENNLLAKMRIKEMAPLQAEKQKLTQQVESFQRMLAADISLVKTAEPERQDALLIATDGLYTAIEENLHLTSVAQSINKQVMHTIVEAMAEQQRIGLYGRRGQSNAESEVMLSVNLNERA